MAHTTTTIEPDVDTSDLDLLDGRRHAACNACYPRRLPFGVRFVAMCGREVVAVGHDDTAAPPNACPDCRARVDAPCSRCGA